MALPPLPENLGPYENQWGDWYDYPLIQPTYSLQWAVDDAHYNLLLHAEGITSCATETGQYFLPAGTPIDLYKGSQFIVACPAHDTDVAFTRARVQFLTERNEVAFTLYAPSAYANAVDAMSQEPL